MIGTCQLVLNGKACYKCSKCLMTSLTCAFLFGFGPSLELTKILVPIINHNKQKALLFVEEYDAVYRITVLHCSGPAMT